MAGEGDVGRYDAVQRNGIAQGIDLLDFAEVDGAVGRGVEL